MLHLKSERVSFSRSITKASPVRNGNISRTSVTVLLLNAELLLVEVQSPSDPPPPLRRRLTILEVVLSIL